MINKCASISFSFEKKNKNNHFGVVKQKNCIVFLCSFVVRAWMRVCVWICVCVGVFFYSFALQMAELCSWRRNRKHISFNENPERTPRPESLNCSEWGKYISFVSFVIDFSFRGHLRSVIHSRAAATQQQSKRAATRCRKSSDNITSRIRIVNVPIFRSIIIIISFIIVILARFLKQHK